MGRENVSSIFLITDDAALSEPLAQVLSREGHAVETESRGVVGLTRAIRQVHDLIIVDLKYPDLDGVDLCQRMRQDGVSEPILVLTARDGEVDMVVGLDAGANAYVTKPFQVAVLLARVRALLRRVDETPWVSEMPITLDAKARLAFFNGDELSLPTMEFDLLRVLLREKGHVVTREALMAEVWGGVGGPSRTLDMHISLLRRKLDEDPRDPQHIITVRGVGFRFENEPRRPVSLAGGPSRRTAGQPSAVCKPVDLSASAAGALGPGPSGGSAEFRS